MSGGGPKHGWIKDLVGRFEQPLLAYALSRCGRPEEAERAVEAVFMELWGLSPETLKGAEGVHLYKSCRGRTIARVAKTHHQLLGVLSNSEAEFLRLKFQAGLAYQEIAAVLSTSESFVARIVHEALAKVRDKKRQLEKDNGGGRERG